MICKECGYFWKNEDEDYPGCKFEPMCPGDLPPCEQDDYDYDEPDYDEYD